MARSIRPDQDYSSKLLKLIPTETVMALLIVNGILHERQTELAGSSQALWVAWGVVAALLVLTPLYLLQIQRVRSKVQLGLTSLSFLVWSYALGGPFELMGWHDPQVASIILIVWTLFIPFFVRPMQVGGGYGVSSTIS